MSTAFSRPEHALRKAQDLEKYEPEQALKILHTILGVRRFRTWQDTHDEIMKKYIDLAVERSKNVKEAVHNYRTICILAGKFDSLEKMLSYYIECSEKKFNEIAIKTGGVTVDVKEDEFEESPEDILMRAVSGEDSKSRADRQLLAPWLKYMGEAYRTVLDILRNNPKLQNLYHQTARGSFHFFLKHQRHSAFRRMCETLRSHFAITVKYQGQVNTVDIKSPETQKLYLETRFLQLKIASDLELWQEAYRTIEDIHENMKMTDNVHSSLLVTYYEKMTQIFWASGNNLFHAYSLERMYALTIMSDKIDPQQKRMLASAVLLASLSVSPTDRFGDQNDEDTAFDIHDEGNLKLANLLGFKKEVPTRRKLMQLLMKRNILADVSNEAATIHRLLENNFGPLTLYSQLRPLFAQMESKECESLNKYVAPLKELAVLRLLQQLSRVFKTLSIDKFRAMSPELEWFHVERLIMGAIRSDQLQVRIDHKSKMLVFSEDRLESDRLKNHLFTFAQKLSVIADRVAPASAEDNAAVRKDVFDDIQNGLEAEHAAVFERQKTIERIKQETERKQRDREQKESAQKRQEEDKRRLEEEERRKIESQRREHERQQRQKEAEELLAKKKLAEQIEKQVNEVLQGNKLEKANKKLLTVTQNLEKVDRETLISTQQEVLQQDKLERERVQRDKARRHEYLVRSIIAEEKPILEASFAKQREEDKERLAEQAERFLQQQKQTHARDVKEKHRLLRMNAQRYEYYENVMQKRREQCEELKEAQDERIAELREQKKREAAKRRVEEAKRRAEAERQRREEEERIAAEEAKRRVIEEERRRKREEEQERQRRLDEIAAKQRQREEEIERADAERREREREPRRPAFGGDREREREPRRRDDDSNNNRERERRPAFGGDREREREREPRRRDDDRERRPAFGGDREREREPRRRDDDSNNNRDRERRPAFGGDREREREPRRRDDDNNNNRDRERRPANMDREREREPRRRDDDNNNNRDRERRPAFGGDREREREPRRRDDDNNNNRERERRPANMDREREREPRRRDDDNNNNSSKRAPTTDSDNGDTVADDGFTVVKKKK